MHLGTPRRPAPFPPTPPTQLSYRAAAAANTTSRCSFCMASGSESKRVDGRRVASAALTSNFPSSALRSPLGTMGLGDSQQILARQHVMPRERSREAGLTVELASPQVPIRGRTDEQTDGRTDGRSGDNGSVDPAESRKVQGECGGLFSAELGEAVGRSRVPTASIISGANHQPGPWGPFSGFKAESEGIEDARRAHRVRVHANL
ncbi:hypothetical protein AXG93_3884s1450 [Marchantia polymorpha subsp. ruderalis]|uniref:Uncharacterized protein n=1 Tax=Marchantia polymorpha subsp. ruderalis TaxID=1480154 RepID=A0A176W9N6_MARPO|nr:hypothetical protein AXG93_3884s1450 [Marchantia polymorpha subsp. ruderalis]